MLSIPSTALAPALKAVASAASSRPYAPILECVRVEAGEGRLRLEATDMDLWLRRDVACPDGLLEPVCVAAGDLRRATETAGAGDVAFKPVKDDRLQVSGAAGRCTLPTLSAVEFPSLPALEAATLEGEIDVGVLRLLLPMTSREITRTYLGGVRVNVLKKRLRLTSTDGHQGAIIDTAEVPASKAEIIVPAAAIVALPVVAGLVKFRADASRIEFAGDGWTLNSRLIDGTFPQIERVVPDRQSGWADVEAAELRAAVARVAWVDGLVTLTCSGEEIAISRGTQAGREASASVRANVRGEARFQVKAAYLLNVVAAMASDIVGLSWADENSSSSPIRIDPVGPNDGSRQGVVCPLRIR